MEYNTPENGVSGVGKCEQVSSGIDRGEIWRKMAELSQKAVISSNEELNMKLLVAQNKNLTVAYEQVSAEMRALKSELQIVGMSNKRTGSVYLGLLSLLEMLQSSLSTDKDSADKKNGEKVQKLCMEGGDEELAAKVEQLKSSMKEVINGCFKDETIKRNFEAYFEKFQNMEVELNMCMGERDSLLRLNEELKENIKVLTKKHLISSSYLCLGVENQKSHEKPTLSSVNESEKDVEADAKENDKSFQEDMINNYKEVVRKLNQEVAELTENFNSEMSQKSEEIQQLKTEILKGKILYEKMEKLPAESAGIVMELKEKIRELESANEKITRESKSNKEMARNVANHIDKLVGELNSEFEISSKKYMAVIKNLKMNVKRAREEKGECQSQILNLLDEKQPNSIHRQLENTVNCYKDKIRFLTEENKHYKEQIVLATTFDQSSEFELPGDIPECHKKMQQMAVAKQAIMADLDLAVANYDEISLQHGELTEKVGLLEKKNLVLISENTKLKYANSELLDKQNLNLSQIENLTERCRNFEDHKGLINNITESRESPEQQIQKTEQYEMRKQLGEWRGLMKAEVEKNSEYLAEARASREAAESSAREVRAITEKYQTERRKRLYPNTSGVKLEGVNDMEDESFFNNQELKLLKAKLTCSICNLREKNAIIFKCCHLFCYQCLKARYETRQRKCPTCNSNFGSAEFNKIYY